MGYYINSKGNRFELEDEEVLDVYDKDIVELDLSDNINLRWLVCDDNQLTQLDLSNNINLTDLNCINNQLTQLNLINNINLKEIACANNYLTSLDVSTNINLRLLLCDTKTNLIGIKQFLNNINISFNQI